MMSKRSMSIAAALVAFASTGAAGAQSGWDSPYARFPRDFGHRPGYGARDPREGKIETATFLANSANVSQLGHGSISLASSDGSAPSGADDGTLNRR